jgi:predicted transcriptional regulator
VTLGPLEHRLMECLWDVARPASVRDVHDTVGGDLAYTTLMTTLDRLFKKGLLRRRKVGRAFLYEARQTKQERERGLAASVIGGLLPRDLENARPVLSCLVDAVGERDHELLDELERLVRAKREQAAARKRPR